MTEIYIIRHAEAEGNLYRRIHGVYDSMITESGHEQVESLKKRFESVHIDAVYSSDLTRTKQTAAAVYLPKSLPLFTTPRLREVNMGSWEDVPWGDVERDTPEDLLTYNFDTFNWNIPGCETFPQATERMISAVRDIASKHEGQAVAVVTHGTAIRAMLLSLLGMKRDELPKLPYSDNTAVSKLEVENGEIKVICYNDNSHLPEGQSTFARQHWWKAKGAGKLDYNMSYAPLDMEKDAEKYAFCYEDAWRIAHGSTDGFDALTYVNTAKRRAAKFPGAVMQSFLAGKPAGLIELDTETDKNENVGNIAFYYMREEYRGRDIGVQLLGYAISVYRALGRNRLRLRVAETNSSAVRFYERYGFVKTGKQKGVLGDLFIMEKDIALPKIESEAWL